MTGFYVSAAVSKTGAPTVHDLVHGVWMVKFEKSLGEIIPVYAPSRDLWGRLDYTLFHQGRKGVIIGADGWLFTDEEFSCPPHFADNIASNMAYVAQVRTMLQSRNTQLMVVPVPAKARVYSDRLGTHATPSCRTNLYKNTLATLKQLGIPAADLLPLMEASPEKDSLYLKTDTHWAPAGARLAAAAAAKMAEDVPYARKDFATTPGNSLPHDGDLARYVPGVGAPYILPDSITSFADDSPASSEDNLFGEDTPEITLVGTSYSANPLWNFEGFLKSALKADVLNMADEGLGPFAVMETYLKNDAWKNTPPKLVIWEIPERYIMTPSNHRIEK
ncbi:MAG TPA: hypothetical protein VIF12_02400 [Micavibrio sp.]